MYITGTDVSWICYIVLDYCANQIDKYSLRWLEGVGKMPSLGSLLLPPPQDSREFEQIMRDYCSEKYSVNACVFARRGQKQYGVDVVSSGVKGIVAIQCKDYQDTKTTKDKIDK